MLRSNTTLAAEVGRFLESLARANLSLHTRRSYASDLKQFAEYFSLSGKAAPAPSEFDALKIREFMAACYRRGNSNRSVARKLSALRSFFDFLVREGVIPHSPAKLVATPKTPQTLPAVMTAEETNALIDALPQQEGNEKGTARLARDRLIFELLYGSGLRVGELVGLNLDDLDRGERWIRVRGKGRKERLVPFGRTAGEALDRYLHSQAGNGSKGAATQLAKRAADGSKRREDRQALRSCTDGRSQPPPALPAARLRHAPAQRRCRPASHSRTARTRQPLDDPEVHPAIARGADEDLRPQPPEGVKLRRPTCAAKEFLPIQPRGDGFGPAGMLIPPRSGAYVAGVATCRWLRAYCSSASAIR